MPKHPLRLALVILAVLFVMTAPGLVTFVTNYFWFGEVGQEQVFLTVLRAQAITFTAFFAVSALWLAINLRSALSAIGEIGSKFTTSEGIELPLPGPRQLQTIVNIVAIVMAVLFGLYATSQWQTFLTWWYAVPFAESDPILGNDMSFYVFSLPFFQMIRGVAQALVVIAALGSGALYFLSGSLASGFPASLSLTGPARRHLSLLAAIFLLLLAFGAWLARAEYLVSPSSIIFGAG